MTELLQSIKQVGLIGLGIMGQPMVRNLMKAGFDVTVYSRTREKVESMVSEGARAAESPHRSQAIVRWS